MVGWHHQLRGHEYEQTPGDSGGQRSLACYSPWGCKDSHMTDRLKNSIDPVNQFFWSDFFMWVGAGTNHRSEIRIF